jgi:glutaredoxin
MSKDKWVVLKQDRCEYCVKALDLLRLRGVEAEIIDISTAPQLKDFMRACGLTTVPQIYQNGDRIGGFAELQLWFWERDEDNGWTSR